MKRESLELHFRRNALGWTIAGIILSLTLAGTLGTLVMVQDTARQVAMLADSALISDRTDILSGDVRSLELQLRRKFEINDDEALLFLDPDKKPWVADLRFSGISSCLDSTGVCPKWFHRRIIVERPIYFDEQKKHLWGYLHIEKVASPNWTLVFGIALATICGMLLQGLGFYFNLRKVIGSVSQTLGEWARRLSTDPRDSANYSEAPFAEIEPIGRALAGLKSEIDALEAAAKEQGALVTLRGIGHDILNPVSRMKRIVGVLAVTNDPDARNELMGRLDSSLRRLSVYADQLKQLYKVKTGEALEPTPTLNLSAELRSLGVELSGAPELVQKRIEFVVDADDRCHAKISSAAFGRIVENLCTNGVHASPVEGRLSVRVQESIDRIALIVEDEGPGIAVDMQKRIFEADFTTKANHGTGLGLFVVKQLCEQNGANLSVDSAPGRGARFRVEFAKCEVL